MDNLTPGQTEDLSIGNPESVYNDQFRLISPSSSIDEHEMDKDESSNMSEEAHKSKPPLFLSIVNTDKQTNEPTETISTGKLENTSRMDKSAFFKHSLSSLLLPTVNAKEQRNVQTGTTSSETIDNVYADKPTLVLPTVRIDEQKIEETDILSSRTPENIYNGKSPLFLSSINNINEEKTKQTEFVSIEKLTNGCGKVQTKEKGEFAFTWIIENFSMWMHNMKQSLESPRFLVENGSQRMKLYLKLLPKDSVDENYIACFVYKDLQDLNESFPVSGTLSYLTNNGTFKSISFNSEILLTYDINNYGSHEFLRRSEVKSKRFLSSKLDALTIHCKLWWNQSPKPIVVAYSARTQLKVEKYRFTWEFLGVRKKTVRVPPLMESKISVPIVSKHLVSQFDLELKFISLLDGRIHIIPKDIKEKSLYCTLKMKLKSRYGDVEPCEQDDYLFEPLIESQMWIFPTFPKKNDLKSWYDCGKLTLFCELSISDGMEVSEIEEISRGYPINDNITQLQKEKKLEHLQTLNSTTSFPKPCATNETALKETLALNKSTMTDDFIPKDEKCFLKDDLLFMLKNEIFCDLTLLVNDNKYNVHKSVLAVRSPVFNDIIKRDIEEGLSGELIISDSDPKAVYHLISYLYTDQVEDLELEPLLKLYDCAEKYQVFPLRDKCYLELKSIKSLENTCKLFLQDDTEQNENLKNVVVEFICNHVTDILDSEEWEITMNSEPHIAGMIMKSVCIRLSQKCVNK